MRDREIHRAIAILKDEISQWAVPIVGQVAERSRDPFLILISCLLSLRTKDETTATASRRLFALAETPQAMRRLRADVVERAIYPVGFYRTKARTIRALCEVLIARHGGLVPDRLDDLLSLPGVGRKTANLVVTLAFRKPGICVDTHVHRISNRWGYVTTKTPEQTEMALREKLPRRYWIIFNDLLVPFGQHLCRPISPFCSRCRLRPSCARVGVTISR